MCTVLLPPDLNPIAVDKSVSYHFFDISEDVKLTFVIINSDILNSDWRCYNLDLT